jgi:hypothetical protein
MLKIDKKIVGYKVLTKDNEIIDSSIDTVDLSNAVKILDVVTENVAYTRHAREEVLSGRTYKIRPQNSTSSYYITINNQTINGVSTPMEIFINSKNIEHFQWMQLATRLISAVFRKGGDIDFIIEELQAIHDPMGGYWGKDRFTGKGKFFKSIINEIGDVVKEHLETGMEIIEIEEAEQVREEVIEDVQGYPESATVCSKCSIKAVVILDGCATCLDCGDSKCG